MIPELYLLIDDVQQGPFAFDEVQSRLASGVYGPDLLAWWVGAPDWTPLATVPGLVARPTPPPPPVRRHPAVPAAAPAVPANSFYGSVGTSLLCSVLGMVIWSFEVTSSWFLLIGFLVVFLGVYNGWRAYHMRSSMAHRKMLAYLSVFVSVTVVLLTLGVKTVTTWKAVQFGLTAPVRLANARRTLPFVNSQGMEFIPVQGKPGILMCRTETRVRDFRAYINATNYVQYGGAYLFKVKKNKDGTPTGLTQILQLEAGWKNPGFKQTEDDPVCCVSPDEAQAFCDWLSKKEGLTYRLPTDQEWSAAVGDGKYPWGGGPPPKGTGNYFGAEAKEVLPKFPWVVAYDYSDGYPYTAPVGSFNENNQGFYDLGGNVLEWCSGIYQATMNDSDVLEQFPWLKTERDSNGTFSVTRGGSWSSATEAELRSSFHSGAALSSRSNDCGFRCVLVSGGKR